MDLFNIDLATLVSDSLGGGLLPATLVKVTAGTLTAGALTAGTTPQRQSFACRGVVLDYSDYEVRGGLVKTGDRKVLLLAKTIDGGAVPAPNDLVTIEDVEYLIVEDGVRRDPAGATYECRARR